MRSTILLFLHILMTFAYMALLKSSIASIVPSSLIAPLYTHQSSVDNRLTTTDHIRAYPPLVFREPQDTVLCNQVQVVIADKDLKNLHWIYQGGFPPTFYRACTWAAVGCIAGAICYGYSDNNPFWKVVLGVTAVTSIALSCRNYWKYTKKQGEEFIPAKLEKHLRDNKWINPKKPAYVYSTNAYDPPTTYYQPITLEWDGNDYVRTHVDRPLMKPVLLTPEESKILSILKVCTSLKNQMDNIKNNHLLNLWCPPALFAKITKPPYTTCWGYKTQDLSMVEQCSIATAHEHLARAKAEKGLPPCLLYPILSSTATHAMGKPIGPEPAYFPPQFVDSVYSLRDSLSPCNKQPISENEASSALESFNAILTKIGMTPLESNSISLETLGKTYRRASLKVHPDKVANETLRRLFPPLDENYKILQYYYDS